MIANVSNIKSTIEKIRKVIGFHIPEISREMECILIEIYVEKYEKMN